ncbi:MAG: hypothetical protein K1X36_10445 [Pyrinomonadaceae bacterium]|nr:hypothetical protein [Pyrinomonadaceae bacterium]
MNENKDMFGPVAELPDSWWYKVYVGVIVSLVIVLAALWSFSRYFSS